MRRGNHAWLAIGLGVLTGFAWGVAPAGALAGGNAAVKVAKTVARR